MGITHKIWTVYAWPIVTPTPPSYSTNTLLLQLVLIFALKIGMLIIKQWVVLEPVLNRPMHLMEIIHVCLGVLKIYTLITILKAASRLVLPLPESMRMIQRTCAWKFAQLCLAILVRISMMAEGNVCQLAHWPANMLIRPPGLVWADVMFRKDTLLISLIEDVI